MKIPAWTILFALCACARVPTSIPTEGNAAAAGAKSSAGANPSVAWVRALEPNASTGGIGTLEARAADVDGKVHLALTDLDVRVSAAGHLAAFEVEHRFHNDSDDQLEGTFRFTLPPGAVVTGLAMNIGEEMMEGEFVDRDKARQTFEKIVDAMRDPALLEWEQGKAFKLRVFPIEPHADKRVVLRYFAPLGTAADGSAEIVVPLAAADLQHAIPHVDVHVVGAPDSDIALDDVSADQILRVKVPAAWRRADVLTERAEGARFTAIKLAPRWDELPAAPARPSSRRVVLVVDSSRSALEAWPRVREAVATIVGSLGTDDVVAMITSDITVVDHSGGFAVPSAGLASKFDRALDGLEPDGASDLGSALAAAQQLVATGSAKRTQVVYIGDGAPTWGELDTAALAKQVGAFGDAVEFHAIALGKRADDTMLRTLSGRGGGAMVQPTQANQIAAAADFLAHSHQVRALGDVAVQVEGGEGDIVLPPGGTWFEGQEPIAYLRTPENAALPKAIILRGTVPGAEAPAVQRIALNTAAAVSSRGLSRLWASREIEAVANGGEDAAMKKDQIILLSQQYGVLSRHTSLLVLESEEAYEKYEIERKQAARRAAEMAADPTVSGADLESVGLSPGDLQPGDPEIWIPAPADAVSVAVVFPFGETKLARWDEGEGKWVVRFLVADDTAAGTYRVRVRITHADGRVEMGSAEYSIDMTAPVVDLRVIELPDAPGTYRVVVTQRLTDDDAARERREGVGDGSETASTLDLGRVRAVMPDGQTIMMRRMADGHYARNWTPRIELRWPSTVELAVTDRALNTRAQTLELTAPGESALSRSGR